MMALAGTLTFEFEVGLPLLAEKTVHGNATAPVNAALALPPQV
jgi:hypothetical protein